MRWPHLTYDYGFAEGARQAREVQAELRAEGIQDRDMLTQRPWIADELLLRRALADRTREPVMRGYCEGWCSVWD